MRTISTEMVNSGGGGQGMERQKLKVWTDSENALLDVTVEMQVNSLEFRCSSGWRFGRHDI